MLRMDFIMTKSAVKEVNNKSYENGSRKIEWKPSWGGGSPLCAVGDTVIPLEFMDGQWGIKDPNKVPIHFVLSNLFNLKVMMQW